MIPWYVAAILTIGSLIAGHLWGIIACKQPMDEAYEIGYENGIIQGREMERSLRDASVKGFWSRR